MLAYWDRVLLLKPDQSPSSQDASSSEPLDSNIVSSLSPLINSGAGARLPATVVTYNTDLHNTLRGWELDWDYHQ